MSSRIVTVVLTVMIYYILTVKNLLRVSTRVLGHCLMHRHAQVCLEWEPIMAFRKYVQKNHDVGFHRHASHTNSEKLHRVRDRRSRALSYASSYPLQGRNGFMAWLLEGQGIEDEEFVVHKLAFTLLLTILASLAIASPLAVDDVWRGKILIRS